MQLFELLGFWDIAASSRCSSANHSLNHFEYVQGMAIPVFYSSADKEHAQRLEQFQPNESIIETSELFEFRELDASGQLISEFANTSAPNIVCVLLSRNMISGNFKAAVDSMARKGFLVYLLLTQRFRVPVNFKKMLYARIDLADDDLIDTIISRLAWTVSDNGEEGRPLFSSNRDKTEKLRIFADVEFHWGMWQRLIELEKTHHEDLCRRLKITDASEIIATDDDDRAWIYRLERVCASEGIGAAFVESNLQEINDAVENHKALSAAPNGNSDDRFIRFNDAVWNCLLNLSEAQRIDLGGILGLEKSQDHASAELWVEGLEKLCRESHDRSLYPRLVKVLITNYELEMKKSSSQSDWGNTLGKGLADLLKFLHSICDEQTTSGPSVRVVMSQNQ